ncbi:MAG: hypothetical protein IJA19_00265 [Clostridia bacterium]|nr:hypothetical protein [Clostridia bacterium]
MSTINVPALSGEIDVDSVTQCQKRVDDNSVLINEIVDKLVAEYCGHLDNYLLYIRQVLSSGDSPSNEQLDDFCLSLPVLLYFAGEAQEKLGVKEDVANACEKELFNRVYSEAPGTIADKTAKAQLQTQKESIAHIAYKRAYNCIKLRVEAAYETLNSIKKVLNRRIAEYGITNADQGRMPIRNGQREDS